MKATLFFLFLSLSLHSQSDTIFIKSGSVACTITFVNNDNIFYYVGDNSKDIVRIPLTSVMAYVKDGVKVIPEAKPALSISEPGTIKEISITEDFLFIKECLRKHSKQYYTGFAFVMLGYASAGAGVALYEKEPKYAKPLVIGGAVVSLIGHIVMVNSHKWFKRAAFGINGTEVKVKYRLD